MATEPNTLVSAERARAILDMCSVYPVSYPPIVAASVQLQKATCALLEAAPDLAETVIALHAEVKRLSTANIDLHDTLRATARACTLPEDTAPAALPAQVEACIRDLSGQIERLTAERDRLQRACDEGLPRELILCPACGQRHIDGTNGAEFATRPHHTHLCAACGHVWDNGRWSFGAADRELSLATRRVDAAWVRIAKAHRVDPSPANAEWIAGLCERAASVRDEALALRNEALERAQAERDAAVQAEREACLRLCAEHRARYANTDDGWSHNNYETHQKAADEIEDAIRQRGPARRKMLTGAEALERLAVALPSLVNATDEELDLMRNFGSPSHGEDALTLLHDLRDAASKAYLAMDHRAGDAISAEVDSDAAPCLALLLSLLPDDAPPWQAMVLYSGGMGLVPVIAGDPHVDALDAARSLRAQLGLAQETKEEPAGE